MLYADDKEAIEQHAADLALAYDDPAVLAQKLAEWAKQNLPERVSSALWITAKGDRDKGIEILLHEVTLAERLKLRIGAVIGSVSAGLTGTTPVWQTDSGITVSVGAGAVVRYADVKKIEPIAVVSLRF